MLIPHLKYFLLPGLPHHSYWDRLLLLMGYLLHTQHSQSYMHGYFICTWRKHLHIWHGAHSFTWGHGEVLSSPRTKYRLGQTKAGLVKLCGSLLQGTWEGNALGKKERRLLTRTEWRCHQKLTLTWDSAVCCLGIALVRMANVSQGPCRSTAYTKWMRSSNNTEDVSNTLYNPSTLYTSNIPTITLQFSPRGENHTTD